MTSNTRNARPLINLLDISNPTKNISLPGTISSTSKNKLTIPCTFLAWYQQAAHEQQDALTANSYAYTPTFGGTGLKR